MPRTHFAMYSFICNASLLNANYSKYLLFVYSSLALEVHETLKHLFGSGTNFTQPYGNTDLEKENHIACQLIIHIENLLGELTQSSEKQLYSNNSKQFCKSSFLISYGSCDKSPIFLNNNFSKNMNLSCRK